MRRWLRNKIALWKIKRDMEIIAGRKITYEEVKLVEQVLDTWTKEPRKK